MFSLLDEETLEIPIDIDRIGSFHLVNFEAEYSPVYNNFSGS
jgi:hypothetical protein